MLIYDFNSEKGLLTPNDPDSVSLAPRDGPRHFAFHPSGKFAYVINEMKSTVTAMTYDAKTGTLKKIQTLPTLPKGVKVNNSTAEVQVHPSGRFVYGSNRGHNSIVCYRVDQKTGKLTYVANQGSGIKVPRNFGIDPTGKYVLVASQAGNNVRVFAVDQKSGKLVPTKTKVDVPTPVCVKFMRIGK